MFNQEQIPLIPDQIGPYVFRGNLGEGATAVVKLAFNTEEKTYSACKVISKQHLNTEIRQKKFETEIRIMQSLRHPGVVELRELLQDDNFYFVFIEFCANGELFEYIVQKQKFTENEGKNILKQILEALQYIHQMGIAHRDLKPENILLDTVHHIKLTDFGLSKKFFENNNLCQTPCGSPFYASPETISGREYDPFKADIWSAGVILYVMVVGNVPWTSTRNNAQLFQLIKNGQFSTPNYLSDSCRDLINRMMCVDPAKRITINEIFKHKFMMNAEKVLMAARDRPCAVSAKMLDEFFGREEAEELKRSISNHFSNNGDEHDNEEVNNKNKKAPTAFSIAEPNQGKDKEDELYDRKSPRARRMQIATSSTKGRPPRLMQLQISAANSKLKMPPLHFVSQKRGSVANVKITHPNLSDSIRRGKRASWQHV